MTRWSDQAWKAAEPVYRRIIEHPFVGELAAGSLSEERFRYYLRQDALYLDGYARRLAHIAARLTRKEHTEAFLHFALEGIEVERALHASFLGGEHPAPDEISPTCLLYTSVLESQATAPVEVEAAATRPISPTSIRHSGHRATEPSVSPRNRLQSFWLALVSAMASPHLMHLDMLQLPACKQYVRGRLEH